MPQGEQRQTGIIAALMLPLLTVACVSPVPADPDDDDSDAMGDDDDSDTIGDDDDDSGLEPECVRHEDCANDQICWGSACGEVQDRRFSIRVRSAEAHSTRLDGQLWDSRGNPPDMWVEVFLAHGEDPVEQILTTPTAPDSTSASWDLEAEFTYRSGRQLCLYVWDADEGADQFMDGGCWRQDAGFVEAVRGDWHRDHLPALEVELHYRLQPVP